MRSGPYITATAALLCAGGAAVASEGGGGLGEALIQPKIGTIFWTIVTFVIMLLILGRYAWKPLLGAAEARENSIREDLQNAKQQREDAQRLLDEHRELVAQARRERAEALATGQRDAEKVKGEILQEARKEREHLLKQTEDQIQGAIQQARGELRAMTADLAIQAAEKLLSRNLDDAAQRQLVEDYLAELERPPGSTGLPP